MNAESIRALNAHCQKLAGSVAISREQQDVGLKSLEVSMLTEIAAQMAELNDSLKHIAYPPLFIEGGKIDPEAFRDMQPGKIVWRPGSKSLRDEFAMAVMTGLLADPGVQAHASTAELAYKMADVMIEARKQ